MITNSGPTVVVIGAGISGLCVAYWLKKEGVSVIVLEKESQVGGTMKTLHEDGWLIETGPNSALETTPLFQHLFDELGMVEERVYANKAASNRYIVRGGDLHPLPMTPISFITSRLWSWPGKLQLLREPLVGRADHEESIAQFVERRLGREILDYGINPFVAGVFAGDPRQLSVQVAFPKLYALEEKYGGLFKGMILGSKERKMRSEKAKVRAQLFSFLDGMQTFPDSLAARLGESIRLDCTVENIIPLRAGRYPVYTIYGQQTTTIARDVAAVVLATPAYATANIIRPIDPEMAKMLSSIEYPPVAEVFMGFKASQVKRPLDGFGFLVPEKEGKRILGTIWTSTIFPHRAPANHVALTTFAGGARQPDLVFHDDDALTNIVLRELQVLMGIDGKPVITRIIRWDRAIPQYTLGYGKVLDAMERFEQNFRGAFICSNYRGGIAVGDCLINAEKTTKRVLEHLKLASTVPEVIHVH